MSNPAASTHVAPQPERSSGRRPVLTICCITYNHERFIAQALESFLAQRTDFPVEILVHDDHSTDDTANIVRRFQAAHPSRIRAVLREQNQYALGRRIMPMFADWVESEFIAVCEGDDYWTDPEKLQLQVDYLRAHPGAAGCFHDAVVVDDAGKILEQSYFTSKRDRFTQRDVLADLLSREPTCSLVFRAVAMARPLPAWYLRRPSDLQLDLLVTEHGELHFLRRNMAAYRRHSTGSWTSTRSASRVSELILRLQLLNEDPGFNSRYSSLLTSRISEFHELLFTREDFDAEMTRLAAIVEEQAVALASLGRERDRLTTETKAAQTETNRASKDGQKHIDALTAQVAQLAATSSEQTKHIKVLEAERDRLTAETKAAQTEAHRAYKDGQKHIDALTAQVAQLAATSSEQIKHIKVLEAERDRLTAETKAAQTEANRASKDGQKYIDALTAQLDRLAATSSEQTKHIKMLEAERDRLTAETKAAQAEAHRASENGQKHIDALKIQLDQLAATSREQSGYIAILEKERDRLNAELGGLLKKTADYLAVIKAQTEYITMLEVVRDQNSDKRQ